MPSFLTRRTPLQWCAILYALAFFFVAIMGYIPPLVDEHGYVLGLFSLDLNDNLLHAFSGVWALWAALTSNKQVLTYFRGFGTIYFLDGITGLIFGNSYLDLGVFMHGMTHDPFIVKFLLNVPHVIIGGGAVLLGFILYKRLLAWKKA